MPRDVDDPNETEFGLGPGMIDPQLRKDRVLTAEQELQEIYSLPKTFDNSMPNRPDPQDTPVPRLLPGESESDRA